MKAKDVVGRLDALTRKDGELPGEFADRQAAVLLDCGLTKLKANINSRWPDGRVQNLGAIVSLRREFTEWGAAIVRVGRYDWMRPTVGTIVFDTLLGHIEKEATGKNVLANMIANFTADGLDASRLRTGL